MRINPDHELLQYSGRIDFDNPMEPEFVFPCSFVKMNFIGTGIKVIVSNHQDYSDNYIGFVLDETQGVIELPKEGKAVLTLAQEMEKETHSLMLFKRMDSCHTFTFHGFEVEDDTTVLPVEEKPERRIEFFGDSVSAGEVSEAVEYVGKADPEHHGQYSNSWYSYAWITARKLGAEIHDVAQGGIPLLNGTGWFADPQFPGMEEIFDKVRYNPALGVSKPWDFGRFTPHVAVIAIGQNDSHPEDYMAADYHCEKAVHWRAEYKKFVEKIHSLYPDAHIICTTTILRHDESWDRAIAEVCEQLESPQIHHFLYEKNAVGTDGHIRIPEAEQMASELTAFICSLGEDIWK